LQQHATHCNALQRPATFCCNTPQHTATPCKALQHATTRCNTLLQHAAIRSNAQQHSATRCNTPTTHTTALQACVLQRVAAYLKSVTASVCADEAAHLFTKMSYGDKIMCCGVLQCVECVPWRHLGTRERESFDYIILQTYDLGVYLRKQPSEVYAGTKTFVPQHLARFRTCVLQCVAVCCSVLQCNTVCNSTRCASGPVSYSVLQCVAVYCSVLQRVPICCSTCCALGPTGCCMLQCVAVFDRVFRRLVECLAICTRCSAVSAGLWRGDPGQSPSTVDYRFESSQ